MKKIKLLVAALVVTFLMTGGIANAENALGAQKAYVYTELQIDTSFENVPWKEMNPNLKKIKGLLSKTWLSGTDHSAGGFYLFDTIENAQAFVTDVFPKEAENFGVAQTTKIFDAVQTEKASRDMLSAFYVGPAKQKPGAFVYTEVQISALPFDEQVNWLERNPILKELPGLISKTWLSGLHTGTIGGFYAFDTLEHAQEFAINGMPKAAESLNAAYITRVFDANITEDASIDMGSLFYTK